MTNRRSEKAIKVADAVLYEGYILYPYRKSAIKNRYRFNFGLIEPGGYFKTEVFSTGEIEVTVRFLQIRRREVFDDSGHRCERFGEYETWDEAIERETGSGRFEFPAIVSIEDLTAGARYERRTEMVAGEVTLESGPAGEGLIKHSLTISNFGPATMISTHVILSGDGFVSLLEYPDHLAELVASLENVGLFPVLIDRNTMLASPIIMYDFPEVATESAADFYDLTEIDELLALRIRTMTDKEKSEARRLDPRAAAVIDAAESVPLGTLHGAWRPELAAGSRVRIAPKRGADAIDMFLSGRIGIIDREETDLEGNRCYAVILEDEFEAVSALDKNVGHRFYFSAEELFLMEN